jgi:hypothetical protein
MHIVEFFAVERQTGDSETASGVQPPTQPTDLSSPDSNFALDGLQTK